MGCAEGTFVPDEAFFVFRADIAPQPDADPEIKRWIGLSVENEIGTELDCLDTVLLEYGLGDQCEYWVDVLGIPSLRYEELFPGRFAAYEAMLDRANS